MVVKEKWIKVLKIDDHFYVLNLSCTLSTVSDLAHRHWSTILTLHYNQRLLKVATWLQTVLSLFLLDYTCIIVNNIHKHPVKCLLTEKIQNKYFDHAFLSILWSFTWKWSFAIFLDYHGPGHKQITKVRWVYIYIFFFFLVMSVVQNVTWKKSTIVSMEWCQSLIYRDWLASRFQTQSCQSCSSLMPRAKNFKVWIWLFFPSYKLLILYPTVSDPM